MKTVFALIGDLGGTNCRVRLIEISYECSFERTVHEKRYLSKDAPNLESILKSFLHEFGAVPGTPEYPYMVVICVAGPVSAISRKADGYVEYGTGAYSTNLQWEMDSFRVAEALALPVEHVTLINDFEAVGYGILGLKPDQYVKISGTDPKPESPIGVIGPGTGLGEAYLTGDKRGGQYIVHSSEGGHSTFGPTTMEEFHLTQYIQTEFKSNHVSWERICCGTGIRSVYRFFKQQEDPTNPLYDPKNIAVYSNPPAIETDGVLGATYPSQIIFERAKNGDELCTKVVSVFLSALGRETGNLAATLLPYGGIYLAGGMAPKIRWALDPSISTPSSQIDNSMYTKTISEKGRLKPFLQDIPVYLVLIDEIGLLGCIVVAKRIGLINTTHAKL